MLLKRADRSSHSVVFVVKRRTKRTLILGLTVVSRSPRSKDDQGKTKETGTSHDNDGRSSKLKNIDFNFLKYFHSFSFKQHLKV